jgi:hypothetical protein
MRTASCLAQLSQVNLTGRTGRRAELSTVPPRRDQQLDSEAAASRFVWLVNDEQSMVAL